MTALEDLSLNDNWIDVRLRSTGPGVGADDGVEISSFGGNDEIGARLRSTGPRVGADDGVEIFTGRESNRRERRRSIVPGVGADDGVGRS